MSTTYDYEKKRELGKQRESLLAHMQTVVSAAGTENRDLSATEQKALEAGKARLTELDAELKEQSKAMLAAVLSLGNAEADYAKEYGVGGSKMFSEMARTGIITALKSRTAFRTEIDRKALTSGTLLPPTGTAVEGGVFPTAFPLASLFREQPADGPVVRYYRMDGATADVVPEGAVKPDAGVSITPVDVALQKIACVAVVSDEMSEDAPYLIDQLAGDLQRAVLVRENRAILDSLSATSGLVTMTGAAAAVVDLAADAVGGAEAINGTTPSAIIAHPTVIATIRKAKADTAGVYTVDPLSSSPATLHGVPLVSTPATAPGTVWVVGGQGVVIYRRGPIVVEFGLNDTNWVTNTRTARCEERMAVAVVRPAAITRVTLT